MKDDSAEILFQSLSATGHRKQFWHEQERPFFDVVRPAFHLLTTAWPSFQDALKDGLGKAVVACDAPGR